MNISQIDTATLYRANGDETTGKTEKKQSLAAKETQYGKAVGDVSLSDAAAKYYEELKEKYGDSMNFVLVSEDMKDAAESVSGMYASTDKLTVLIDTDKIERMATDEAYREKYENLLTQANAQMSGLSDSLGSVAEDIVGYGMKVNDDGTATYFAVLKDMNAKSAELREARAEKAAEEKKAEKKEESREAQEEAIEAARTRSRELSGTVTIEASSVEELVKKIQDYTYASMSDNILSEQEKNVGQNFDFSV